MEVRTLPTFYNNTETNVTLCGTIGWVAWLLLLEVADGTVRRMITHSRNTVGFARAKEHGLFRDFVVEIDRLPTTKQRRALAFGH